MMVPWWALAIAIILGGVGVYVAIMLYFAANMRW
jgi:hypothetical protein